TNAAAELGHNFLAMDEDGVARRFAPFIVNGGKQLPSLGVAAALVAGGFRPGDVAVEGSTLRVGDRPGPLVRRHIGDRDQWALLVNYRAPSYVTTAAGHLVRPYPTYQFKDVFAAEQEILTGKKPRIDPSVFKDKIVFIGLTASGLLDVFSTPMG